MDAMIRNLKRHEAWEAEEGFEWTQWQALQLQTLKEFRERNGALFDQAFSQAVPLMDEMITSAYHEGEQAFDAQRSEANAAKINTYMNQGKLVADIPADQLANAVLDVDQNGNLVWVNPPEEQPLVSITQPGLDQIPDKSFFKVNEPKLKAVLDDVHTDMDKVRYAALNRMGAGYEEIIHKADIFYQTGTMTLQQAVDMASKEFLIAGLNCVEYENGRRVNIATYVEMALRTSSRRAQMTAEGAKRDEWKEFLVISPALATTCPTCYKYQALVMIDDVFAHGKPDGKHLLLSKAVADNFLHPNCRHPLVSFFEGITQIPRNSPYDQTRSNYDAEQRQRMIETMIRRYKRLRDGSVDPDNVSKYDLKVRQWEGLLKRHLAENPDFRRKPEREKYTQGEPIVATASIRFLNKNDNLFDFSQRIKPLKGFEDVVCHGDSVGFTFKDTAGKESNISANDFADMIKESPDYKGGNVRLITCSAGAEGGISAQGVADRLGIDVLAPDKTVYVTVSGEMYICDKQDDIINPEKQGKWLKFSPKGGK